MAWRPTEHLIEGELDNTTPGKVTGWMRFAGMDEKVTFDLQGNFHRDIRGAKIRLTGEGVESEKARRSMKGFDTRQIGKAGDITAGLPPYDYGRYVAYIEWYGDANGRVVIELDQYRVQIIGRPIPWCESDPISREEQAQHMAGFLNSISQSAGVTAITVGPQPAIVSDPTFTHWVVELGRIVGEAHTVHPVEGARCLAYVRLFCIPERGEYGYVAASQLQPKNGTSTPNVNP